LEKVKLLKKIMKNEAGVEPEEIHEHTHEVGRPDPPHLWTDPVTMKALFRLWLNISNRLWILMSPAGPRTSKTAWITWIKRLMVS
jgi:hypothetical protein